MIVITDGDLTRVESGIIAHQVNTQVMGSGLARSLYSRWPLVRTMFLDRANTCGWVLGTIQVILVDPTTNLYVVNCCGQESVGGPYTNTVIGAVETYARRLADLSCALGLPLYIPEELGCGLAGPDDAVAKQRLKNRIHAIFHSLYEGSELDLYIVSYRPHVMPRTKTGSLIA